MIERFKEWVTHHKALAIGGGIALAILLWLMLRPKAQAAPDQTGLQAYYGAQAASAADTASIAQSTNELAAATNQVNAQRDVALAGLSASSVPYQAQLDAITQQLNFAAYHDYLGEVSQTGPVSPNAALFTAENGQQYVQMTGSGGTQFIDPTTGAVVTNAPGGALSGVLNAGDPFVQGTYDPQARTFVAVTTPKPAPVQFGDFKGITSPTVH